MVFLVRRCARALCAGRAPKCIDDDPGRVDIERRRNPVRLTRDRPSNLGPLFGPINRQLAYLQRLTLALHIEPLQLHRYPSEAEQVDVLSRQVSPRCTSSLPREVKRRLNGAAYTTRVGFGRAANDGGEAVRG